MRKPAKWHVCPSEDSDQPGDSVGSSGPKLSLRTVKTLIRLGGCDQSSMGAKLILLVFSGGSSNVVNNVKPGISQ